MLIISYGFYKVIEFEKHIYRIELAVPLERICLLLGCKHIRIHSYIRRVIKQVGYSDLVIFIPRIICDVNTPLQRTHVLLPDFILPYSNYTVKSLSIVFPENIPRDTVKRISLSDWDRLINVSFRKKNCNQREYVQRRVFFLLKRFLSVGGVFNFITRVRRRAMTVSYPLKKLKKYYLFTAKKSCCINVLSYIDHTIYQIDSS